MKAKIMVLYYSMFGNNFLMAKAVCQGITESGGEVLLRTGQKGDKTKKKECRNLLP